MPIQFINGLALTGGPFHDKFIYDEAEALLIPIHRITSVSTISHCQLEKLHKAAESDEQHDHWTVVHWEGTEHTLTAYLRHDLKDVMKAIAILNTNPDRTTCYVDDRSERNCG